jgi:hypothetical protein
MDRVHSRDPSRATVLQGMSKDTSPQTGWRVVEDSSDGLVELSNATEPCGESDLIHRESGGLQEDACRLSSLRSCQSEGTNPKLESDEPVDLPLAIPQLTSEPMNAFTVDNPISYESHCAPDDVTSKVPLW